MGGRGMAERNPNTFFTHGASHFLLLLSYAAEILETITELVITV